MKKLKNCIFVLLAAVVMMAAFSTPALAYTHNGHDQNLPPHQYKQVESATKEWEAAHARGDKGGETKAHEKAENARKSGGNYSGGADGSEYIPYPSNGSGNGGGGHHHHHSGGGSSYTPVTYYSITASAGTGGSISPSGSTSVSSGSSQTYTINANSGYKIADVKVDGSSVGASSTYAFSSVTSAHTISAEFASNASVSVGGASLGDGGSGTLKSGNATKSGYGVTANVSVAASYVSDVTVTASYNFTSAKTVSLENVGGTWQFPVNSASVTGARKVYIPVEAKDGTYTITFHIKALDPQATALTGSNVYLSSTKSVTITVKGSMYEDDFTGNS